MVVSIYFRFLFLGPVKMSKQTHLVYAVRLAGVFYQRTGSHSQGNHNNGDHRCWCAMTKQPQRGSAAANSGMLLISQTNLSCFTSPVTVCQADKFPLCTNMLHCVHQQPGARRVITCLYYYPSMLGNNGVAIFCPRFSKCVSRLF